MYEIFKNWVYGSGISSSVGGEVKKKKIKPRTRVVKAHGWRLVRNFIQYFFIKMIGTQTWVRDERKTSILTSGGNPLNEEWKMGWVICGSSAFLLLTYQTIRMLDDFTWARTGMPMTTFSMVTHTKGCSCSEWAHYVLWTHGIRCILRL